MTIFKDKIFNVKQFSDRGYNSSRSPPLLYINCYSSLPSENCPMQYSLRLSSSSAFKFSVSRHFATPSNFPLYISTAGVIYQFFIRCIKVNRR